MTSKPLISFGSCPMAKAAIGLALIAVGLSACNPPSMWRPQQRVVYAGPAYGPPVGRGPALSPAFAPSRPPVYQTETKKICYDRWGREITPQDFRDQGYKFLDGDHCYEIGIDPRPGAKERSRIR